MTTDNGDREYNGYVADSHGSTGRKFALDASVPTKIVLMRGTCRRLDVWGNVYNVYTAE